MTAALPFVALGLNAFGSMQQSKAIEASTQAAVQQQEAQARADRYNQSVALQNAQAVDKQTQTQLEVQDKQRRLRAGTARAGAGASGIGAESFGDIFTSNAAQEELDLLTIQSEGALKAKNFRDQAGLYGLSAEGATNQIPSIKKAGKYSKAASIISGASSGIGSYANIKVFNARN